MRVAKSGGLVLLVSQGASSVGNMLLAMLIARESSVHEFASFALAIPLYSVAQRFARTYIMIPRQIELNRQMRANAGPPPLNSGLALSGTFAGVLLIVSAFVGGSIREWLFILGLSFPGLILYDCVRNEYLSRQQFRWVLGGDVIWLLVQVALATGVTVLHLASSLQMVCWSIPPLAMGVSLWATHWRQVSPSPIQGCRDLWRDRHVFSDSATTLLQSVLTVQVLPYVVAGLASFEAVAALRAGQTLLGPINVAVLGLIPLVQMAVARRLPDKPAIIRIVHSTAGQLSFLCVGYAVVLMLIPQAIGRAMFGDTWRYATIMLLPLAFHVVGRTPFSVVTSAMRAAGQRKPLVRIRMATSILLLCGAAAGALAARSSIAWIGWGMFVASTTSSLWLYIAFRKALAGPAATSGAIETEGQEH